MTAFSFALRVMLRDKGATLWGIGLPFALATLFYVAFGGLDASFRPSPVPVAVVDDAVYRASPALSELITATSEGQDPYLEPTYVTDRAGAERLVNAGGLYGYIAVDADGAVEYHRDWREYIGTPGHEIVTAILDSYVQGSAFAAEAAAAQASAAQAGLGQSPGASGASAGSGGEAAAGDEQDGGQGAGSGWSPSGTGDDPRLAAGPAAQAAALRAALEDTPAFTKAVQLTANPPSDQVRYFYAVLGFSALMVCGFAVSGLARLRANRSALGARLSTAGHSQVALLAPTAAAAYTLSFATLAADYLYIRFILGIGFGGKDIQILAILAVAALTVTALGAAICALPLPEAALSGIIAAISTVLSLFAGLYGPGSQDLADKVAQAAPWSTWLNPAREVYDALFSLYNYDTFGEAAQIMLRLAVLAVALLAVAAVGPRRTRHEHL
ncbi:MAG: ABC transporter permease [Bifidobacteriaceae bacterium]|jgi:hypothetical protein|nr:ABC transporter permease [Bifidobacteriaceae bacterium]